MKLTLVVNGDLLLKARKIALNQQTSVNQLVREYLAQLVENNGRKRLAKARLKATLAKGLILVGERNWSREDLHER